MCTVQAVAADELGKSGPDESPTEPGDNTGIGKGWDYAPGQAAADTARTVNAKITGQAGKDEAIARAYTERLLGDEGYGTWYDSIERQVDALRPKLKGMKESEAVSFLRDKKNIADHGSWPVAVLSAESQGWLGVEPTVRTVQFSTDTAVKQILKRAAVFGKNDYQLTQAIIDEAEFVSQVDGDNSTLSNVYFRHLDQLYTAVVKVTQDKKNLYLTSIRMADERGLRNERKKADKKKSRVLRGSV